MRSRPFDNTGSHRAGLDAACTAGAFVRKNESDGAWASRTRKERAMNTVRLEIEGMHCDGCAANVQSLLERQTGVKKATASYADKEARVLYDPGVISEDQVAGVVERAGYGVTGRSHA
jgi:copper chaperone